MFVLNAAAFRGSSEVLVATSDGRDAKLGLISGCAISGGPTNTNTCMNTNTNENINENTKTDTNAIKTKYKWGKFKVGTHEHQDHGRKVGETSWTD